MSDSQIKLSYQNTEMSKLLTSIQKGNIGEKYTCRYLKKNGYRILERNMRNHFSEIDIIAENREYIVFVEVKTRTTGQIVSPSFAVNSKKQRKILSAAYGYMIHMGTKKQPRFDISEVFLKKDSKRVESINYIENAFTQGGTYAAF